MFEKFKMKPALIRACIYLAIAVILLIVPLSVIEERSLCLINLMTGFKCPTCGMTRAFANALRFRYSDAFAYNKLVLLFYPAYVFLIVDDIAAAAAPLFGKKHTALTDRLFKLKAK